MKKTLVLFCMLLCLMRAEAFWSPLPSQWGFHQTANKDLHYTEIPEAEWQSRNPARLLRVSPEHGVYGWYRVYFSWDEQPTQALMLYLQSLRHADETWLNGEKIGGSGTLTRPWGFANDNPRNLARKYPIPPSLLKPEDNILAIKINLGFADVWGGLYPGSVGIGSDMIGIGDSHLVQTLYTQRILQSTVIDTILIVLGIMDIFIIIFLFRRSIHHFHEFWWLLIGSLTMMLGSLLLDYFYVRHHSFAQSSELLMLSLLCLPYVNAMYFWSIHRNVSRWWINALTGVWLVLAFAIVFPETPHAIKNWAWLSNSGLAVIALFYCLYCAIIGVRKRTIGACFQLFGLVVFLLSIRTQWLPIDMFGHRNILVGTLVLRYAFLFSYFQRINRMSFDYKQLSLKLLSTIEDHKQEIARDLHDDLGQHLSAAKMRFILYYQGDTKNSIDFIRQEIDASLLSVRELIDGLHPQILERYPLIEVMQIEAERLAKLHSVTINVMAEAIDCEKSMKKHLFRIFQETIHNAIKHGKATHIDVEINDKKQQIRLRVTDNGLGFELGVQPKKKPLTERQGFGLVSLRERTALINGQLRIQAQQPQGTVVTVTLQKQAE